MPLLPRKLRARLLLTYLLVTLVGLGGLILWTGVRLQDAVLERGARTLQVQALLIAHTLSEPVEEGREGKGGRQRTLAAQVQAYAQSVGARVTVLDPAFHVLVRSDPAAPTGAQRPTPELLAASQGQVRHAIRRDTLQQTERLFVAAPIRHEERELAGLVQLSVATAPLYAEMRRTWAGLLTAGGIVLLVMTLVSVLLAHHVTGPLWALTAVTEAMAAGQHVPPVTPAGPDEIVRLGQTFNQMAAQVHDTLTRQRAFVANAAHELRSPLASLRLRLEMLVRHGLTHEVLGQHYLRHMAQDIDHLQRLVEHLLALSRFDEGDTPPRSPLDLAPVLYDLLDETAPLAHTAGVRLQVEVPAHLPGVMANADAMRMLVRNLLDNAIKYSPPGGQVTVRATTEDQAGPAATGSRGNGSGSEILIQVTDTGPGIPAEHLPHIFERFYRVDKARSRQQGGVGLGLALVRSIAANHGGWVHVESTIGEGSTFTVHLPCSETPPAS